MSLLEVKSIFKTYDSRAISVVDHVSFKVLKNEVISVIGPSGTGKSTVAKIIAGLLEFESGEVFFQGKKLLDSDYRDDKLLENISYVPQELSLDANLTVFENIGKNLIEENEEKRHHLIRDMIEVFGLQYKDDKYPHELSTGQKGRVEMAKALVTSPKLLILDEPFANLDKSLRNELKEELLEILEERKISAVIVTHDLEDAFSHSDKILVLSDGKVKQFSESSSIYFRPIDAWVAKFSGAANLIAGKVIKKEDEFFIHESSLGIFKVKSYDPKVEVGKFAYMLVRPESISINNTSKLRGKILSKKHLGPSFEIILRVGELSNFKISVPNSLISSLKKSVSFDVDALSCQLLTI
jgi:ABC-type Fe3+/spermidine/putrescine transport system ATPase subunit